MTIKQKIILGAIVLSVLSVVFSAALVPQGKPAQAGEESVSCNKEIPIGEALEEAAKFTGEIRNTVFDTEQFIEEEIAAAQDLIAATQQCDPNKCNPVCRLIPNTCYTSGGPGSGPIPYSCPICESDYCTGEICPENSINDAYAKVEEAYNKIASAQKTGESLINDKKSSWEYSGQKFQNQTQVEIVEKKLSLAREEFDKCFLTETEWQKYIEGETVGKQLVSCEDSLDYGRDLSQECRDACNIDVNSDKCRECLECKNPGNFFCCDVK